VDGRPMADGRAMTERLQRLYRHAVDRDVEAAGRAR
jgi:hypothetical protein